MDALIGASGGLGVVGAVLTALKLWADTRIGTERVEFDREAAVTAEVWKYIESVKADKDESRREKQEIQKALIEVRRRYGELQADHTKLQGLYVGAIERVEDLERGRERDKAAIRELGERINELETTHDAPNQQ